MPPPRMPRDIRRYDPMAFERLIANPTQQQQLPSAPPLPTAPQQEPLQTAADKIARLQQQLGAEQGARKEFQMLREQGETETGFNPPSMFERWGTGTFADQEAVGHEMMLEDMIRRIQQAEAQKSPIYQAIVKNISRFGPGRTPTPNIAGPFFGGGR